MSDSYSGAARFDTGGSEYSRMEFLVRQVMNRQATCTIVRVAAVDSAAGLLDVTPLVGQVDGDNTVTPHGTIHNIPYVRAQGGTSAVIIDPLVGDMGVCVFAQHDISTVKNTKKAGGPGSRRKFDWADAIYMGGMLNGTPEQYVRIDPNGVTIQAAPGKNVTLVSDTQVTVTTPKLVVSGTIETGAGSKFNGKEFDTHKHSGVATGGGTSGPPV